MQKSASIQPRTSLSKFGGKFDSLFIRLLKANGAPAAGVGAKTTPAAVSAKEETAASPKTPLFLANGRDGQANDLQQHDKATNQH